MIDVLEAVRAHLLDDSDLADLVGTRVYAAELRHEDVDDMPRKAAVVVWSGGTDRNDFIELVTPRIDVYSYGETYYEAGKVDRAIYDVLKVVDRETISGALLHGVAASGGPLQMRHRDTGWPIFWRSYSVSASTVAV